jgi:hypothetical protein
MIHEYGVLWQVTRSVRSRTFYGCISVEVTSDDPVLSTQLNCIVLLTDSSLRPCQLSPFASNLTAKTAKHHWFLPGISISTVVSWLYLNTRDSWRREWKQCGTVYEDTTVDIDKQALVGKNTERTRFRPGVSFSEPTRPRTVPMPEFRMPNLVVEWRGNRYLGRWDPCMIPTWHTSHDTSHTWVWVVTGNSVGEIQNILRVYLGRSNLRWSSIIYPIKLHRSPNRLVLASFAN